MKTQPTTGADALAGARLPATAGAVESLSEARGCRLDVVHRPGPPQRSPLERFCHRHVEIAQRHGR
ncbi:MAG: hypothetical protein ACTHJJ_18425, partial [Intrasporangium sp.]|uniref:hypothetical protein n=1 Tax=Intrasporangium sp. TaxID=1925024 RepID=UPI003F7F2F5C